MKSNRSQRLHSRAHGQRGIALAMALIMTAVIAVMASMILFSTQEEVSSSHNYAAQEQAVYAADAGVENALNWFENNYGAVKSASTTVYTANTTPVKLASNSSPVILDSTGGNSNYPTAAAITSWDSTFGTGSGIALGATGENYKVKATLLVLRSVTTTAGPAVLERWEIASTGTWAPNGAKISQVTLNAYYEPWVTSSTSSFTALNDAMFATGHVCNAITMTGSVSTDSYNSSLGTYAATHTNSQGNIGANGGISITGSAAVHGAITVPGGAVGSCNAANPGDLTKTGSISYTTLSNLTTLANYPSPQMPSPWAESGYTSYTLTGTTTLSLGSGNYGNVTETGSNNLTLTGPASLNNVTLTGTSKITLAGGTAASPNVYNFNSLSVTGSASMTISPAGAVIINIVGSGTTTPLTLTGSSILNPSPAARNLFINYAGTSGVTTTGGASAAYVLYAPSAPITFTGSSDAYGAIIGSTITDTGGAIVHYDMALYNSLDFTTTTTFVNNFQLVGWNRTIQ